MLTDSGMKINAFIVNGSTSLLDINKSLFNETYLAKNIDGTFYLTVLKQGFEEKVLCFPLPNNKLAGFLLLHIAYLISFIKIASKINLIIFSQVADYPFLVLFLGKMMNKRILDFIGGSRFFLSQTVLYSKTRPLRKVASIYALIALKFTLHFADRIVLITDSLLSDKPFNKFRNKVHIARNFPSEKLYDKFKIKKEYNDRDFVVGYVGAFTLAKGVYDFALAVKQLIKNVREMKFVFVGDYQNSEPPYLGPKIKQMFEGCNNVIFTGRVPHEKVADYLNKMMLLVLPSYSEGFPHVVLEAMACGTPVAASPVGAIPEILKNGRYGYLLSSRRPKLLASEMMSILTNSRNGKLSKKISKHVRTTYTYEKAVGGWNSIIKATYLRNENR